MGKGRMNTKPYFAVNQIVRLVGCMVMERSMFVVKPQ